MKKTVIVYGKAESTVQKRALEELTAVILDYTLDYPICEKYREDIDKENARLIYLGTRQNNPYIANNSKFNLSAPESYGIEVKNDTVIIEGYDDAGTLYGVLEILIRKPRAAVKHQRRIQRGSYVGKALNVKLGL